MMRLMNGRPPAKENQQSFSEVGETKRRTLEVVDHGRLRLFPRGRVALEVERRVAVGVLALLARSDDPIRRLQEAAYTRTRASIFIPLLPEKRERTVISNNLLVLVARERRERLAREDDGEVKLPRIDDQEAAARIDWANVDLRVRASDNTREDTEHVEPAARVEPLPVGAPVVLVRRDRQAERFGVERRRRVRGEVGLDRERWRGELVRRGRVDGDDGGTVEVVDGGSFEGRTGGRRRTGEVAGQAGDVRRADDALRWNWRRTHEARRSLVGRGLVEG